MKYIEIVIVHRTKPVRLTTGRLKASTIPKATVVGYDTIEVKSNQDGTVNLESLKDYVVSIKDKNPLLAQLIQNKIPF